MTDIVYLNGEFCKASDAKISIFDRGLLFADSVYEVVPVYQGQLFCLDKHLKRLAYSLKNIKIAQPTRDWLHILNELIRLNGGGDMQVYLQITRGNQGIRKHDIPTQLEPTIIAFVMRTPFATREEKKQGLHAKLIEDIRWLHCDIKTTALLGNVLLNDEAASSGSDTAILTRNGFLTEGAAANLFIVSSDDIIRTPPLNNLCLPGITRQIVIDLIKSLSLPFSEENIPTPAIFAAKEVWITSATKEIYPVTRVNDEIIGNGQAGVYWNQLHDNINK